MASNYAKWYLVLISFRFRSGTDHFLGPFGLVVSYLVLQGGGACIWFYRVAAKWSISVLPCSHKNAVAQIFLGVWANHQTRTPSPTPQVSKFICCAFLEEERI